MYGASRFNILKGYFPLRRFFPGYYLLHTSPLTSNSAIPKYPAYFRWTHQSPLNMPTATVLVLGTCDTKLQELLFLKDHIERGSSVKTILLDVGRDNVEHEAIDISQAKLIADHGLGQKTSDLPRGEVIKLMASCATRAVQSLLEKGDVSGVISAGVRPPPNHCT